MASFPEIPASLLDDLPAHLRASMQRALGRSSGSGHPAGFENETSDEAASGSIDYGRIVSAPMSRMSFREAPCYVRFEGLGSDKGRSLNGRHGWAFRRAGERLRVLHVEGATHPGAFEDAKASLGATEVSVQAQHLRLARFAAPAPDVARASGGVSELLYSARCGDVDETVAPEVGFFVFYPGLRRGANGILSYDGALRVDAALVGGWGGESPGMSVDGVRALLQDMKAQRGLDGGAWDPLDGPGWPGIYFCLLYTSPSPRDQRGSRMPSSA